MTCDLCEITDEYYSGGKTQITSVTFIKVLSERIFFFFYYFFFVGRLDF